MSGKYEIHVQVSETVEVPGWEFSVMTSRKKGVTFYLTSYAPTEAVAHGKLISLVSKMSKEPSAYILRTKIEQIVFDQRYEVPSDGSILSQ
jgi:hypothetical protein